MSSGDVNVGSLRLKNVYESVAVSALCFAAGFVSACLAFAESDGDFPSDRKENLRAINFSHSPLDPAIGDMILESGADEWPCFHLLELKATLEDIVSEREKLDQKQLDPEKIDALLYEFPKSHTAHVIGWIRRRNYRMRTHFYLLHTGTRYSQVTLKSFRKSNMRPIG
jgi:hypothetical protein